MKYIFMIGFVLMAVAHWIVPISMINESNNTLTNGVEFKFKTAPVDPSDPFRGKYITLSYDQENYHPRDTAETHLTQNSKVYAIIEPGADGYAQILELLTEPPEYKDREYIAVTYGYGYNNGDPFVHLEFPFDRFYLEESKASDAEQVYWRNRQDSISCYAKVRVLSGDAKVVDVIINDSSIVDVVNALH